MPDQKKPNEPNIITVPVTPPLTDTPTETPPAPPGLPSLDVDVSSLPDEVSSTYAPTLTKDTVKSDPASGSAAPVGDMQGLGIPPVISSSKPKGKFSGKTIATILGVLILVGGLGAGVVLVRQQQDIRSKAGVDTCRSNYDCGANEICLNGDCATKVCTPGATQSDNCIAGSGCPGARSRTCNSSGTGWSDYGGCTKIDPNCPYPTAQCTDISGQYCNDVPCSQDNVPDGTGSCPDGPGGGLRRYCCKRNIESTECTAKANQVCTTSPCAQNQTGTGTCPINLNCCTTPELPTCPNTDCMISKTTAGSVHCKLPTGGRETYCCPTTAPLFTPKQPLETDPDGFSIGSCGTGTPKESPPASPPASPPDQPQVQCQNVKAYDTSWKLLTAVQLSALKAGDKVRFTISGTATGGTIDKAMFKINGGQDVETSQKKPPESAKPIPAVEEFYIEYTIPAGTTSFTITAKLHHSTLGWL